MHATQVQAARRPPVVAGVVLVAIGLAAFVLENVGLDLGHAIGEGGWPFFVILPGLALLTAGFLLAPPRGIGFAVAGSVVTTVGLILLQNVTNAWDSWAYVWALIPTTVGFGLLGYGAVYEEHRVMRAGLRLAIIGSVLFVVGRWYLGAVLENGQPPIVIGAGWPWLLVIGGALLAASAFVGRTRPAGGTADDEQGASPQ